MDDYRDDYEVSDYSDFYDVKPPKRHSFAKGFICGLLLTLVAFLTVFIAGLMLLYKSDLMLGVYPQTPQITGESETFDEDAVLDKLNLLGLYVDQTYLFDYDESDLAEGIYKGYMNALGDPYTVYYTKEEFDSMMESQEGSYYGIGILVSQDIQTGVITIVRVFQNSPAMEAGVRDGDVIYMVDGDEVTGQDLSAVVSRIKGQEGTDIPITFYRPETGEYLEFQVERRQVEVDTVLYRMMDDQAGYIEILEFDEPTAKQFKDALEDLKQQGMESLIVDVRNNPGGLVDSVVEIVDELVPEGLIVYMENSMGMKTEYSADETWLDLPLVVLVNGESASAAEILAGAVRDRGTGTLIGTNTFGKGIAQSLFPLEDGSAVKITTSDYYTPSGENIHGKGIMPDIEVEMDDDSEEDTQLTAALEYLRTEQ